MSVDVQKEQQKTETSVSPTENDTSSSPSLIARLRTSLSQLNWRDTLGIAALMAVGWCFLFLQNNIWQYFAGIVPVTAGLFLGKRVKQHVTTHGIVLGVSGFLLGLLIIAAYAGMGGAGLIPLPANPLHQQDSTVPMQFTPMLLIQYYISFSLLAMIPFPAFGTVISYKNEQRRLELESVKKNRGGELEKPHVVRTLDDVQGLSLPKFGTYVSNLFKKQGFKLVEYQFEKDKYLDLEMQYEGDMYLLRLSVSDRVNSGLIEKLVQDMRQKQIPKGIAIVSTEFTPDAKKSARGRQNIVLIDGQTLFDIGEH
jgi:hypothetical protein